MREVKFKVWTGSEMLGPFDLSINPIYWDGLKDGVRLFYTGYKDCEGKEIYEGDIIRIYDDELMEDEEGSWTEEVSFHMGGFFAGDENLIGNVNFRCKIIKNYK